MITKTTLKNAAKALGYDLWSDPDGSHYLVDYDGVKLKRWEPEHDDGDALRLAVHLGLSIDLSDPDREEVRILEMNGNHLMQFTDDDSDAAVRRAIVMTSARIGESL